MLKEDQVKQLLEQNSLSWEDFRQWIIGQTIRVDEKGIIYYFIHDVERYIEAKLNGEEPYI